MRVAYTLEQCWHRVPGGTASAALEVARELAARNDVEVVGVAARHRAPPAPAWAPPVPVAHLPLPRLALYEAWHVAGRPAVQRATGAVDVIHATGVAVPPRSAPLVVTVHDLAFVDDPAQFTAKGRRFFAQALRRTTERADLVLCSSSATRAACERAGLDPARLRVVPLGVRSCPASADDVTRVRHRYGLLRPYVLSVGTVEPRKNLAGVVDAVRRLDRSDVDWVLVGPAGWNVALDDLIRPVSDRVRVLGFLPAADRDALYAGAAVFCYPSLLEGFGLPVLEAMAQGAPVVTSTGTATEEAAGDASLLVDPRDPPAIAGALASILDDAALAARLSAAGRRRAACFPWSATAARTVDAYREVVSR